MYQHTEVQDSLLLDLYKHLQVEPTQLSREEAEEHCNERCRLRFQVRLLVEPLLYEELFKVEGWVDRAKELIKERQTVAAIRHCREVTGARLKTAKLAIYHLVDEVYNSSHESRVEFWKEGALDLLKQRRPVSAMQHCRSHTGMSIADCKDAVERLAAQHNIPMQ